MTPDFLFSLGNPLALLSWVLLVFAPRWQGTRLLVLSGGISLLLAAAYLVFISISFIQGAEGSFSTLSGVAKLFENRYALLAGWFHYLAFDLFVGSWEVRDAQQHKVPHLLLVPCLLCTFMLGPVGLLLYFGLRSFYKKRTE